MAFPALTSEVDGSGNGANYDSLFQTLFVDDTFNPPLAPEFTLVISRDSSQNDYGGSLTIGGVPNLWDPTVNASGTYSSAAFQLVAAVSTSAYSFYSIDVDAFAAGGATYDANTQVIVDSGANILALPETTANAFNSLWSSGGSYDSNHLFVIDCTATPGDLGISIGGTYFYINPVDLMAQYDATQCYSLVQPSDSSTGGFYVLGDPFLRNVVAVYNWGTSA